jgi:hypothetical protein
MAIGRNYLPFDTRRAASPADDFGNCRTVTASLLMTSHPHFHHAPPVSFPREIEIDETLDDQNEATAGSIGDVRCQCADAIATTVGVSYHLLTTPPARP